MENVLHRCAVAVCSAGLVTSGFMAFAATDELPAKFDASTGYVLQTQADSTSGAAHPSFMTNNVGSTGTYGSWGEEAAVPHAGTNYCVSTGGKAGTIVTPNATVSADTTWTFAGDKLVINGSTLQNMSSDKNYPCIPELYMLNGGAINWYGWKNKLTGNCHIRRSTGTAYGTWGGPVRFYSNADLVSVPQEFGMVVDGDSEQNVAFLTSKNGTGARSSYFKTTASWANYHGTILVTNNCPEYGLTGWTKLSMTGPDVPARVTVATNCLFASQTPNINLVGLTVRTHRAFEIAADGTWQVGDLALTNTMEISFLSGTSRFVVTNSLTRAAGAGFRLTLPEFAVGALPAADIPLVTFEPTVDVGDLTADDFDVAFVSGVAGLPSFTKELVTNDQGQVQFILHVRAVIESNNQAANAAAGPNLWYDEKDSSEIDFWSDGEAVHDSADYLLWKAKSGTIELPRTANATVEGAAKNNAYVFPGDSLTVNYNNLLLQASGGTLGIIDFKFLNVAANLSLRSFASPPTIDGIATARFLAPMSIAAGKTLTSTAYGSKNLRFEGEISGSGDIKLSSYRSASAEATNQGATELLGLNTNFTGRIYVDHEYYTKASPAYTIPNDRVYCKLFTRDGRSLGGPLAAFDFDSLWLRHWGCFIPRESVTLDQANRGVYVSDVGQFQVDAGVKLTIRNPLTMKGTLNVRAATAAGGTLALGGPLRFVANDTLAEIGGPDPADDPTNNLMVVSKVFLQALATNSFDGAALTLKDGAGLVVDPCATGEVANYGLVNLRGSITVENGERIPVRLEPSAELTGGEYVVAICTVPSGSALTAESFDVTRPKGYSAVVTAVTDASAGTKTFRLTLQYKGLILLIR